MHKLKAYNVYLPLVMKFAIISDIHDNLSNLDKALAHCQQQQVQQVVFCGDFCSPFVVHNMGTSGFTFHCIFGNNDGDKFLITTNVAHYKNIKLYGEYIGEENNPLTIEGIKIAATHYPFYAKPLAKTGWYDCVFFGHNHIASKQKFGACLMLNPGSIAGINQPASFAIYDCVAKQSTFIEL